ncbi:MAG: SDR family NAD(P)-dependent oxidoreductase [Flavobacteriaceae bacterium]
MNETTDNTGFRDQVCLITGAAGAIGSATAEAFAAQGASLFLVDRAAPEELAERLRKSGATVTAAAADVTRDADIRASVNAAMAAYGRIDILVNVAGIVSQGNAEDISEEEWDRVLGINLKGTFLFCRAVMPVMRRQQYGRIVNLGSVIAMNGGTSRPWLDREELRRSGNVAYGASKAGVHALTGYLAKDLAGDGVTVNAVAPGPIATSMTTRYPQSMMQLIPLGRMGRPEEVAHAILYLASREAGFITGEVLDINGGLSVG